MLNEAMVHPILILVGVFGLAAMLCAFADPIGRALRIMDYPEGIRKRHARATPEVGGIAILVPLLIWVGFVLASGTATPLLLAIGVCAAGVGLVGFTDDQSSTTVLARMLSLMLFIAIAFVVDPELVAKAWHWHGQTSSPVSAWVYVPIMAVAAIGLVNAVNMADGLNGVVSGQFVIWTFCLLLVSHETIHAIAGVMLGLSLIVLAFNLANKLFLGDTGTYGATFVVGLLVTGAHAKGYVSIDTIIVWFFIPVADCLRLVITRPLLGKSPFIGDRDHLHHRLEDKMGRGSGLACYLGAVAVTSVLATLEPRFALVCAIGLTSFYLIFALLTDSEAIVNARAANKEAEVQHPASPDNVVPLLQDVDAKR